MESNVSNILAWLEGAGARVAEGSLQWILAAWGVATAVAVVLFGATRLGFLWLHRRIAALQGVRIHAIRYRGQEIFSQQEVTLIVLGLLRFVRYGAYAILFYAYLTFVFGLFPATRNLAGTLFGYFTSALGTLGVATLDYLPSLAFLVVLVFITRSVIKLMGLAFDRIWRGRIKISSFPAEFAQPTFRILRFLVIVFAVMVAYPYLPGSGSPAFQAVEGPRWKVRKVGSRSRPRLIQWGFSRALRR